MSASEHAPTAIRNAGVLLVQRGFHALAGLLFALLVPRAMGAVVFGQYALMSSISLWFALLSGLGAVSMMSHFVPQFVVRNDRAGLERLVSGLFVMRFGSGILSGAAYLLIALFWLRDLDGVAIACVAGAVALRSAANLFFALFLGLNQAGRWGMGELLRRWLTFVFVIIGIWIAGLRGACAGLLIANVFVLALGMWWAREYLRWADLRIDRSFLAPFLRVGAFFTAGNVLLGLTQRSGETLVRLATRNYAQVGFFGAASAVYLIAAQTLWQLALGFAPLLTLLHEQQDDASVRMWSERLLKWMTVAAVAAVFSVLLVGPDLVPRVLGRDYRPVAANLLLLTLALAALALTSVGRLLTLSCKRPGVALVAAAIELAAFWSIGLPMAMSGGSFAACAAVLISSSMSAAFITWRMTSAIGYSTRSWMIPMALAVIFLPLALVRSTWLINAGLYVAFAAGYGSLLLLLRVVTLDELAELRAALRSRDASLAVPA